MFSIPECLVNVFLLVNCYKVLHFERPPAVGLNVVVSDRLTAIRSARPFDCRRHLVQRARRLSQCTVRFLVGEPHHAGPHPLRQTVELPRLRKTHGEGFAHRAEQVPRPTHNRLQIVSFHCLYWFLVVRSSLFRVGAVVEAAPVPFVSLTALAKPLQFPGIRSLVHPIRPLPSYSLSLLSSSEPSSSPRHPL